MKLLILIGLSTSSASIIGAWMKKLGQLLHPTIDGLPILDDFVLEKYGSTSIDELTNLIRDDLGTQPSPTGLYPVSPSGSIVAIPDVHGDAAHFLRSLWLGLVSVDKVRMSFEPFARTMLRAATKGEFPDVSLSPESDTILVQMGDLVDRGPHSLLCLRLLWVVERVIGWRVVSLFGNHEVVASSPGSDVYVHSSESEAFGFSTQFRSRNEAFSVSSPIWTKLASESQLLAQLGNTMFVHAGFDPEWLSKIVWGNMEDFMAKTRAIIDTCPASRESVPLVNGDDSLIWTRLFEDASELELCERFLPVVLARLNVARIVVGHMPQLDHRMKTRCHGRLVLTDVAMSRWLLNDEGQSAILALHGPTTKAIYFDETTRGVNVVPLDTLGRRLNILKVDKIGKTVFTVYFEAPFIAARQFGVLDCHSHNSFNRLVRVAKSMDTGKYPVGLRMVDVIRSSSNNEVCVLFEAMEGLNREGPVDLNLLPNWLKQIHANNILTNIKSLNEFMELFATARNDQLVLISFGQFTACSGPCDPSRMTEELRIVGESPNNTL